MKSVEEQLKEFRNTALIKPDEKQIDLAVERAKKAFFENENNRPANYLEFLNQQSSYIRKKWWILQFMILVVLYWLLDGAHSDKIMQRNAGVLAPVFVILMIPELWKNRSCAAMEIEGASYYTLRQIYAARMLLFAIADGLLLSIFTGMALCTTAMGVKEIILQFFLPMIVTCCICFRTLCSRFTSSEYIAVSMSTVWIAIWEFLILQDKIYNAISLPLWIGVSMLSFVYFIYVIHKVMRECGNCWEVTMTWN